jgi:hypothetical protein
MSKELKLTPVEKWVMKYMNYSLEDIKLLRIVYERPYWRP